MAWVIESAPPKGWVIEEPKKTAGGTFADVAQADGLAPGPLTGQETPVPGAQEAMPAFSAEVPSDIVQNLPGSLGKFAKGVGSMVMNPIDTMGAITAPGEGDSMGRLANLIPPVAMGRVARNIVPAMVEPYSSPQQALKTLTEDPATVLADIALPFAGRAGGLAKFPKKPSKAGKELAKSMGATTTPEMLAQRAGTMDSPIIADLMEGGGGAVGELIKEVKPGVLQPEAMKVAARGESLATGLRTGVEQALEYSKGDANKLSRSLGHNLKLLGREYDKFGGIEIPVTDDILKIAETPSGRKAWKSATESMANRLKTASPLTDDAVNIPGAGGQLTMTLEEASKLKRGLDDVVTTNTKVNPVTGAEKMLAEGADAQNLRSMLNKAINEADPTGVAASVNEQFSRVSGLQSAVDLGKKFTTKSPDQVRGIASRLKPKELEAFRSGAVQNLVEEMGKKQIDGKTLATFMKTERVGEKLSEVFTPAQYESIQREVAQFLAKGEVTKAAKSALASKLKQNLQESYLSGVNMSPVPLTRGQQGGFISDAVSGITMRGPRQQAKSQSMLDLITSQATPENLGKLAPSKGRSRLMDSIIKGGFGASQLNKLREE